MFLSLLHLVKEREYYQNMTSLLQEGIMPPMLEFPFFALLFYASWMVYFSWAQRSKYPLVGAKSKFEAGVISNFRFYRNAQSILLDGYTKASVRLGLGDEYQLMSSHV